MKKWEGRGKFAEFFFFSGSKLKKTELPLHWRDSDLGGPWEQYPYSTEEVSQDAYKL